MELTCSFLLQESEYHVTHEETDIYPDFVTIASGFGVPSKRVRHPSELRAAIREMLDTPGPYLLDIMVRTLLPGLLSCLHVRVQKGQHGIGPSIAEPSPWLSMALIFQRVWYRCRTLSTCCP